MKADHCVIWIEVQPSLKATQSAIGVLYTGLESVDLPGGVPQRRRVRRHLQPLFAKRYRAIKEGAIRSARIDSSLILIVQNTERGEVSNNDWIVRLQPHVLFKLLLSVDILTEDYLLVAQDEM